MASLAFFELEFSEKLVLAFETIVASVCPIESPCTWATSSLLLQKQSIATEKNADCFRPTVSARN